MSALQKKILASLVGASVATLSAPALWAQNQQGAGLPQPIQQAMPSWSGGSGPYGQGSGSQSNSRYPAVPGPYSSPNTGYNPGGSYAPAPAQQQSAQPWGGAPPQTAPQAPSVGVSFIGITLFPN